jgi:hypothetical protein
VLPDEPYQLPSFKVQVLPCFITCSVQVRRSTLSCMLDTAGH